MILVTGGTGYIGTHTCVELLKIGYELIVLDNLSNSCLEALKRVEKITGIVVEFIEGDIRNRELLRYVFSKFDISAVIHFAGLKSVSESVKDPLGYFDNNLSGSVALFEVMAEFDCKSLVFSSSATVYGNPSSVPIREGSSLTSTNPYGASKLMVEDVLRAVYHADESWSIGILRYFNPVGAHASGLIGEDPNGIPNNLLPYISQVAIQKREKLSIFGGDYLTRDGTGVRDYIHVVDLAKGHVKALEKLEISKGILTVNLGTGRGCSVLDMIKAFEKVSGKPIPYEIVSRRLGDIAECYAEPSYAEEILGWRAKFDITRMCEDVWRWQKLNPNGYDK